MVLPTGDFPTPSFSWQSARGERWTWRQAGAGFLLAVVAGAGFYIGRLSIETPASTVLSVVNPAERKPEQRAETADTAAQRQSAVLPDASSAPTRATGSAPGASGASDKTTMSTEAKDQVGGPTKVATKEQSGGPSAKEPASPPVVLINPNSAGKASVGSATKPGASAPSREAAASAEDKAQAPEPADETSPPSAPAKQQAKPRPPARAKANSRPSRPDSVVVQRGDAYVPQRSDAYVPQRSDAYVPPRGPDAVAGQRRRDDDGEEDRNRREQRYAAERYASERYAEDRPPRRPDEGYRGGYGDRGEYLKPFRDFRDIGEYRRFGGPEAYEDRRPPLRQMYGRDD